MAECIWRQQPSPRLSHNNLVRQSPVDASVLVADDFFAAQDTFYGRLKVWTGATWQQGVLRVWTGTAWATKLLKRWDGVAWRLVQSE
jgi:hypothetical protein